MVSDKNSFKDALNGEEYISNVFDGRRSNVFSVSIYNDNNSEVIVVLWTSIFNYEFYEEFNKKINEIGKNFIVNSKGNIIAFDSYNLFGGLNLTNKDTILQSIKDDMKVLDKGYKRIENYYIMYYTN